MTRYGEPIDEIDISGGVATGISYNMSYAVWDAAIAAGASMEELKAMDEGEFPSWFLGKIVAWHIAHRHISNHSDDAVATSMKGKK